ncbi:MAG: ATP-binding protein [Erythrobacter sp.]|jgi:two-component system sensor histidine kinase HupT/HoxJ
MAGYLPPTGTGVPLHAAFSGFAGEGEEMWIEVIQKMDSVYADLIQSQVALERRNQELEQARDFTRSVLGAMTDVLIVCDSDGTIGEVNAALCRVTGRTEKNLIGSPLLGLFDASHHDAIRGCLAQGGTKGDHDWDLVTADSGAARISVSGAPRHDTRGRPSGIVFVGRPIGELLRAYYELDTAHQRLRQTQQQLLTSEKMAALGRLVAGVAHELNNPISFVFGNMYALKRYGAAITRYLEAIDEGVDPAQLAALHEELRIDAVLDDIGPLVDGTLEGAERVRDIVQDLRRFSSNQREAPERFNLVRLIHTAVDWVVKAQRSKPAIRMDLPQVMDITGFKGQLHQILVNLVQNAVDAMAGQDGAALSITARVEAGDVIMAVADNGPGVSSADQDKIFEPFYTTKPIGSGTGLGLYVSYNMVEKLGGSLTYSDAPGGGACFQVRVPADKADG